MRESSGWLAVPAVFLAAFLCGMASPQESLFAPEDILSENDVGGNVDATQAGRWGPPQAEGERTYRQYPKALSRVGLPAWWEEGDSPDSDVMLVVTFKDTTTVGVTVAGWTGVGGIYGYPVIGLVGGAGDGQWKDELLFCPKNQIRRHPDGDWKGNWSLLFCQGDRILLDRMRVLKVSDRLMAERIRQGRAKRATAMETLKKQFVHVPPTKQNVELGEIAQEFRRLGFIPFARSYTIDVYRDTIPLPDERGVKTLSAFATPGEFEPIQVAVHALEGLELAAGMSDLKCGRAALKAGEDVEVFQVEYMPVRPKSSWGREWQERPTWLRPLGHIELKAGESLSWYIRVRVPEDAEPGVYKGVFRLSHSLRGGSAVSIPVEFRVLPFKLDKVDHYAWGPYVSGIVADEFIQDLADHGMNSMSMFAPNGLRPKLEDGRCVADVSDAMNNYLKTLRKSGFVRLVDFGGGDPWYNNPSNMRSVTGAQVGSPQFEKYYAEYWQDIKRLEKGNGWPEIICCPFDEPVKSEAKTRNYEICYDIVKKAVPDTKVFCVFMNRTDSAKRLGLKSDIWSCNGAFDVNQAEKRRLAGRGIHKLFYTYTGCMAGYRPGSARYNSGVVPWHYDADGTYFWAYLWTADDPFNDLDGGHRDWSPIARDVDGSLYTCTCWEGYREGVDDRRYIETCLRLAREKGRQDVIDEITVIKDGIRPGDESVESRRTRGLDDFFIKLDNAVELDVIRARVVGMILDMLGHKM